MAPSLRTPRRLSTLGPTPGRTLALLTSTLSSPRLRSAPKDLRQRVSRRAPRTSPPPWPEILCHYHLGVPHQPRTMLTVRNGSNHRPSSTCGKDPHPQRASSALCQRAPNSTLWAAKNVGCRSPTRQLRRRVGSTAPTSPECPFMALSGRANRADECPL